MYVCVCFVAEAVRRNHTTAKTSYDVIEHEDG